jgi:hypothetical protein
VIALMICVVYDLAFPDHHHHPNLSDVPDVFVSTSWTFCSFSVVAGLDHPLSPAVLTPFEVEAETLPPDQVVAEETSLCWTYTVPQHCLSAVTELVEASY